MSNLDLALSVALGIGLAAATGFRLFLPLLVLSVAAYTGHAGLNEGFAWLGTPAAVIMLGTGSHRGDRRVLHSRCGQPARYGGDARCRRRRDDRCPPLL
jgi:hypothetical protein